MFKRFVFDWYLLTIVCCFLIHKIYGQLNNGNLTNELDDLVESTTADSAVLKPSADVHVASTKSPLDRANNFSFEENNVVDNVSIILEYASGVSSSSLNSSAFPNHQDDNHHHHHHDSDHYSVAKVDFKSVSFPFYATLWLICACIAKIGFHANNKLSSIFPESCMLLLLGILVGLVFYFSDVSGYQMNSRLFFFYLLPPIILEAGYFMPMRAFFDNIGTILLFAVVGTLFNTAGIAFSLYGLSNSGVGLIELDLDMLHCLVFASLISAVDPVAVLAVFQEIQVNEMLHIVVFGESLLNDAVTVVLYHMFETFSEIGLNNIESIDLVAGAASFFVVGIGGSLVGCVTGLITSFFTRFTFPAPVIEPLLVMIMGYMSYIVAEMFHLSGIMACTFCGIIMKHYVEANISNKSQTTLKYFMKLFASVAETVIFMFLGLATVNDIYEWDTAFVILTLSFCVIYRAIAVLVLSCFANSFRANKFTIVDQFVMAYGGLRGAIAFALVVLLDQDLFTHQRLMVTTTTTVIFFTVFVQGATIKPLVKLLDVKTADRHKPNMNEKVHERVIDHIMAGIEDITGHFGHHELRERFQRLDNKYLKPILLRKSARKMRDRGFSILQVHKKLSERDAEEYIKSNNGVFPRRNSMTTAQSILDLIRSQSECSFESPKVAGTSLVDTTGCGTPLDMNVLHHQSTKKSRDDSRIHHILDDAMFKPRKRFNVHQRNMLPRNDTQQVFHHKSRYHLRKLLHPHHHLSKKGHHIYSHPNRGKRQSPHSAMAEKNKSVSFVENASTSTSTCHVIVNIPDDRTDKPKKVAGRKARKPRRKVKPKQSVSSAETESDSSTSEGGIVIEFKNRSQDEGCDGLDGEVVESTNPADPATSVENSLTDLQLTCPDVAPVAIELSLPWKRTIESTPIASTFTHSMAGDNDPQMCEVPSWVDNYSYTSHAPSPQSSPIKETEQDEELPQYHEINEQETNVNSEATHSDTEQFRSIFSHNNESRTSVSAMCGSFSCTSPLLSSMSASSIANYTNNSNTAEDSLISTSTASRLKQSPEVDDTYGCKQRDEAVFSLPLPWANTNEICKPRLSVDNGSHMIPAHLPQVHTAPELLSTLDDDQLSSCHLSESNEAAVSEDNAPCIPPPWRNNACHARASMAVISPSASFEMDSLHPQPSSQSQRLSEVASHHSEPYLMHHHLIDLPPRPPVDFEITSTLESLDIEDGQTDFMTRVHQWLLSNNPEEQEPLLEDFPCATLHSQRSYDSSLLRSGEYSADETSV